MKAYIKERAINIATYIIIDNNATVRHTAKAFGMIVNINNPSW